MSLFGHIIVRVLILQISILQKEEERYGEYEIEE